MNDLQNVLHSCNSIGKDIKAVLKASTYIEYDDLSGLQIDYEDPEQMLLLEELRGIMDKLSDAYTGIEYLNSVVKHHGVLHRNRRGRYESASKEYTCGSSIEAFVYDHAAGCSRWVKTRVEHNGMDYYLVRWPDVPMQELKVRER